MKFLKDLKSNVVNAFIKKIAERFISKTPWAARVVQLLLIAIAFIGDVPEMLESLCQSNVFFCFKQPKIIADIINISSIVGVFLTEIITPKGEKKNIIVLDPREEKKAA